MEETSVRLRGASMDGRELDQKASADFARLRGYPWLTRYQPWGISPVSLLELQLLHESGRLAVRTPELLEKLRSDHRFVLDEPPLLALFEAALMLPWTRDPFDRLLAAHSSARRAELCTMDPVILVNHRYVVRELR
jgi:PIN domain nuclease of toxin-antitoxin system